MVGIPRPASFFRATGTVDSTAIIDDAVGAVDVANTLVYDMDNKASVVGADLVFIADSEASNINKEATLTAVMELAAGTVTASGIENTNGVLSIVPASLTAIDAIAVADTLIVADATAANAAKAGTVTMLADTLAGAAAATGVVDATGTIKVSPTDAVLNVGADSLVFMTAGGVPQKDLVSDVADAMAGTMLNAASGVISHEATGQMGVGTIRFGATGDCTSVTIGAVTYPYNGSPDTALGQWAYGASASESATNLAAAINLKTASPYAATANTDTVHVYAKTVGTAGNVTITRTGGAQPATVENTVGGLAAATKQWCMRAHTVTANDVDTAVLVNIPMPFTPTMFTANVLTTAGAPKTVTDAFTIGTAPARIVVTEAGATHLIAGDVITITAHE